MMAHSHALSGAAAGLAAGSLVLHEPTRPLALFAALVTAYALAPDLDHCGTTEARSFGPVTEALAWCVEKVSGGHRHGTHSLAGIAAFTGTALLACLYRHDWPGRIVLFVILAAGFASAADALRIAGRAGNLFAVAGAAAMCWTGYGLALVPLAAALGTGTHIVGDMLTLTGCPLAWPLTMREFHLTPRPLRFTTGKTAEHVIVTPLLLAVFAWLCWTRVGPFLEKPQDRPAPNRRREPHVATPHPRRTHRGPGESRRSPQGPRRGEEGPQARGSGRDRHPGRGRR